MDITVQGSRTSLADWEAVKKLPYEQLPPLSAAQREVAKKLGISEEDYARSALAGQRTTERTMAKAERFARYLVERLREMASQASVESVVLNAWDGKFEVLLALGNRTVPMSVAEELVDDCFDSGSPEMERRLDRILNLAVHARVT